MWHIKIVCKNKKNNIYKLYQKLISRYDSNNKLLRAELENI